MNPIGNPLPGVGSDRTATPRRVLLASGIFLPGGKILSGANSRDPLNTGDLDVLRAGVVLGKITSGGKYAPSILGVLAAAYELTGGDDVEMTVSAATATELVRRIGASGTFNVTGPPSAAGTVVTEEVTYSAVNTTTGVITITEAAAAYVIGSFIQPTDGSETPLGMVPDGYGIKVTDVDAASQDTQLPILLIGGVIDASRIVNFPSDASLVTWLLATKLNAVGQYIFDNNF